MDEKPLPKEQRRLSSRYLKLNRLPTLQEVLDRRTRPPLDLFCFYIFLQRESAEDALDFWLDVQQHENLCKAYFKDIKRSGRNLDDEWPSFASYSRQHGSHFSPLLSLSTPDYSDPPGRHPDQFDHEQPSSPIPDFTAAGSPNLSTSNKHDSSEYHYRSPRYSSKVDHSSSSPRVGTTSEDYTHPTILESNTRRERRDTESHGPDHRPFSPTSTTFAEPPRTADREKHGQSHGPMSTVGSRLSMRGKGRSKAPTIIARDRAIEKQALVESAERIYLRYLLPGAEREIYLPPSLRIHEFPQTPPNDDAPATIPDLFHMQKVYIFKALEHDAFPRFLRAKAFGNLTPMGSFVRLVAGLVVLWGGFVLGFSLIFLDYKPRLTRLWLILPFLIALNLLLSAYYSLSPLLALFQQSETTPFHLITVKEPYVRKLITWRATWIEGVCLVGTAVLVVIFTVVPGHRL